MISVVFEPKSRFRLKRTMGSRASPVAAEVSFGELHISLARRDFQSGGKPPQFPGKVRACIETLLPGGRFKSKAERSRLRVHRRRAQQAAPWGTVSEITAK
jgi:hypothetical protein